MRAWALLSVLALGSCATYYAATLDQRYGARDPARYDRAAPAGAAVGYQDVKQILDNRCVVCHGCNDAPCQLNLASWQGMTRGASREQVYATRVFTAEPTRLFLDAHSNAAWRAKGFHPVQRARRHARGRARGRRALPPAAPEAEVARAGQRAAA